MTAARLHHPDDRSGGCRASPVRRTRTSGRRELAAVRAGTVGRVHSWELVTGVDGPGTRLTVFLSGCVLRCLYCHNPDTWRMRDGRLTTLDELVDRIARRAPALKVMHGGGDALGR